MGGASIGKRNATARSARRLARAENLIESFPANSGFEPYFLSVYAYLPRAWRGGTPRDELQRSFRFELDGCCSHLTLFAAKDSRWRREVLQRLRRAGYETWLSDDDSVDMRRWLKGAGARVRELAFLRDLGHRASPERWPTRAVTARPNAVKHGQWPRRNWWHVVGELVEAGIEWTDVAIGVSQVGDYAAQVPSGRLRVVVGVLVFDGGRLLAFASASPLGDTSGRQLPPGLARSLRRVLREAGFKPDGARSSDGRVIRGRVGFDRKVKSAQAAARLCRATFEAMVATVASKGATLAPDAASNGRWRQRRRTPRRSS